MNSIVLSVSLLLMSLPCSAFEGSSFDYFDYEGERVDLRSAGAMAYRQSLNDNDTEEMNQDMLAAREMTSLTTEELSRLVSNPSKIKFLKVIFKDRDMALLVRALSLGTVVYDEDEAIMAKVQSLKNVRFQEIAKIGNFFGSDAILPIAAGSYFIGMIRKDNELKEVGLFIVGGGLATQVVTELFKKSFNRVRPNTAESANEFFVPGNNSFFSGHTSGAFSIATVIAEVYKDKPLVPFLSYGLAALTSYARIHDKKHWASDVLAGAVAGHLVTKFFMRFRDSNALNPEGDFTLMPLFSYERDGEKMNGFSFTYQIVLDAELNKKRSQCLQQNLKGDALIQACIEEAINN